MMHASEELLQRILEAVPAGIVAVGSDGSIQNANEEAQRILGLSWHALSQRSVRDFDTETIREDGSHFPAEEYPVSQCLWTGRRQLPVTVGMRRPDGQLSWAIYTAIPVNDPASGRPSGAVLTFLDITARKAAEGALKRQTTILQSILDSMAEGVIVADRQGNFLLHNPAAERIAGVGRIEADQTQWPERYGIRLGDGKTPCPVDQVPLSRAINGESVDAVDLFIQPAKFSHGKWLSVTGRPLRDGEGNPNGGVVVFRDVTERRRAEEQLREYTGRLQALSQRLLEVQEEERRHFARELHDEVGQSLTGLKLSLEGLGRQAPTSLGSQITEVQEVLQDLMARVRDLSLDLRPSMLDDLGLCPALEWLFGRFTDQTGLRVTFDAVGLGPRLSLAVETTVYRIVQEALTNVVRHAGATPALVRITRRDSWLQLEVEDGGAGFDPAMPRVSSGLSGMQERAQLLGGRLTVESKPRAGTRVVAQIPLKQ